MYAIQNGENGIESRARRSLLRLVGSGDIPPSIFYPHSLSECLAVENHDNICVLQKNLDNGRNGNLQDGIVFEESAEASELGPAGLILELNDGSVFIFSRVGF